MIRFVTGTDTGVGKTVVATALAIAARESGERVAYFKPVQTGVGDEDAGDATFVGAMSGVDVYEGLRLPQPLAPTVAAELTGVAIDGASLVARARELEAGLDLLLVEGAGGLLVPLAAGMTMADFSIALDARLVVVSRPTLGTLNHTALTIEAARGRGIDVEGIVVSGWPMSPGVLEQTNLAQLGTMAPVLGVVEFDPHLDTERGQGRPPRLGPTPGS